MNQYGSSCKCRADLTCRWVGLFSVAHEQRFKKLRNSAWERFIERGTAGMDRWLGRIDGLLPSPLEMEKKTSSELNYINTFENKSAFLSKDISL